MVNNIGKYTSLKETIENAYHYCYLSREEEEKKKTKYIYEKEWNGRKKLIFVYMALYFIVVILVGIYLLNFVF